MTAELASTEKLNDDNDDSSDPTVYGNFKNHDRGDEIVAALRAVFDPEIPVNIYDLGLIYRIDILENGIVEVDMTLTAPGCPVAGEMPGMVEHAIEPLGGFQEIKVELVWEPSWTKDRLSEIARLELGWF
jgi:FeS assembly SUF system protein